MNLFSWLLSLFGLGTSPDALLKRAATLASKGNLTNAVEFYKKAIDLDPYTSKGYDGLGTVYFKMDFRSEAEREFAIADGLDALEKDPTNLAAAISMAKALMLKGLHNQARGALTPLLRGNETNTELLKTLGLIYRALNSDSKARDYMKAALDRNPKDAELNLRYGELELKVGNKKIGKWHVNLSRLITALDDDPTNTKRLYNVARLFAQREKFRDAVPYLLTAVEADPNFVEGWTILGEIYKRSGQAKASIEALNQVVRLSPNDPKPLKLLAESYSHAGDFDMAKKTKEIAAAIQAGQEGVDDPKQAIKYVSFLMKQNKLDEAQNQLNQMINKWPNNPNVRMLHGRMLIQFKKYAEAVSVLKELVDVDEKMAQPHIYLALAYNKMGQAMNALAEGQLSTRLASKNAQAHKVLGNIYRDQKKFSLAAASYEQADRLTGKKTVP